MIEETVWIEKEYVRPRLSPDEVWLIYRLIDNHDDDGLMFRRS